MSGGIVAWIIGQMSGGRRARMTEETTALGRLLAVPNRRPQDSNGKRSDGVTSRTQRRSG
jgi:hypothetical protein